MSSSTCLSNVHFQIPVALFTVAEVAKIWERRSRRTDILSMFISIDLFTHFLQELFFYSEAMESFVPANFAFFAWA